MLCCSFKSCEVKCSLQDVSAVQCSAYAGSGFWLNANSKRQAQHHVLPNCGRKQAPSSCEPTPRLPPELLPEDLWWAPSPGCPPPPPGKEVRPVLGGQPILGPRKVTVRWCAAGGLQRDWHWVEHLLRSRNAVIGVRNYVELRTTFSCSIGMDVVWFIWKPQIIRESYKSFL